MAREWTARSFKSGNSVALRVPAAMGMIPGEEWQLVEDEGGYRLRRLPAPARKFNIGKVWGCAAGSGLHLIEAEDRVFQHRSLLGEDPNAGEGLDRGE